MPMEKDDRSPSQSQSQQAALVTFWTSRQDRKGQGALFFSSWGLRQQQEEDPGVQDELGDIKRNTILLLH